MKKIGLIFMFALLGVAVSSKAVNPVRISASNLRDEERKVSNFNGISIAGSIKVFVKLGNTESLKLEGDPEVLKEMITEVKGGILTIKSKKSQWKELFNKSTNTRIVAYITAKQLTSVALSGSGSIEVEHPVTANNFDVSLSGSGSIKATVNAQNFDAAISGSGSITLQGKAKVSDIKLSGSGSFYGKNLSSQEVTAHVSGSGSIFVLAEKNIEAIISGSGNVYYSGNPDITQTTSGSGKVRKAD